MRIAYPAWDSACRIPRRRKFDPIAALVWLVVMPISAAIGWYGVGRLILWLISL